MVCFVQFATGVDFYGTDFSEVSGCYGHGLCVGDFTDTYARLLSAVGCLLNAKTGDNGLDHWFLLIGISDLVGDNTRYVHDFQKITK